jgi:serine/threonine protein phosphatase PrpC
VHVGDSRAYLLRGDRLALLTTDHVHAVGGRRSSILTRALGAEPEVRLDYTSRPIVPHDRFLLCSDGVHGALPAEAIAAILHRGLASDDCAQALVTAALDAGGSDNATALVIDVAAIR